LCTILFPFARRNLNERRISAVKKKKRKKTDSLQGSRHLWHRHVELEVLTFLENVGVSSQTQRDSWLQR
jgi:hypothetical protein